MTDEFPYREYCDGGPETRYTYHARNSKPPKVNGESYMGIYRYNNPELSGACAADGLTFDIDATNLQAAAIEARKICDYLQHVLDCPVEHIWFSGKKGFHIFVPQAKFGGFEPSELLPEQLTALSRRIAQDAGAKIDEHLHQPRRLLRRENSKHPVSGLYKVPITFSQLCEIAETGGGNGF